MSYFNDINFYASSSSSASGELDANLFWGQMPTAEEVEAQMYGTHAADWSIVGGQGPMVGSPTNFWATAGYDSVAPSTSDAVSSNGYDQASYLGNYWSAVDQPGFSSQDTSFVNTAAVEIPTEVPTPSSVPFDYWGSSQSGPFTSASYMEDANNFYQPGTGPIRTGSTPMRRFQPYGMSSARPNECWNAEAGPSTSLMAPFVPSVGLPTQQPSGGKPETTADAERNQTITEGNQVAKPKRARLPRGQGRPRANRKRAQSNGRKLRNWLHQRLGLKKVPTLNKALELAVGMVKFMQPAVYHQPKLHTAPVEGPLDDSESATRERERREVERGFLQELSKYYELGPNQDLWERPALLLKVLDDFYILDQVTARLISEDLPQELT